MREKLRKTERGGRTRERNEGEGKGGRERDAGHYISFYWPDESNVELIRGH